MTWVVSEDILFSGDPFSTFSKFMTWQLAGEKKCFASFFNFLSNENVWYKQKCSFFFHVIFFFFQEKENCKKFKIP